ncbi:RNA polymerase sigma-70 factor [Mucilaginibacter sp. RS28]|uniref:RNA polymerase sigma-70 factor n=1 Tax=Mucilaginibacter straminoryzae TaxID=2932774 RepID=A0A9X1X1B4_9SPHI|nr:RNA polymerase sigma-70 factor [Mucilaginibacter straminoryzae]MCJ8209213.1 RNA polymerase sigma-70 factor [Mucilaginibacter straminoryzae]
MSTLSNVSDDELLSAFKAGNAQAYQYIYERYWQVLFRFSRKMLQDEVLAKDVVQEVFTTLWAKKNDHHISGPLAAYLYTLTRNRILDMVKRSKVENKYLESLNNFIELNHTTPDRLYIQKELYDQVEKEIQHLPEKMRMVFEMSRKHHKSNQEIADELGITNKTVKNQLSSALKLLRNKLGDSINIYLIFF